MSRLGELSRHRKEIESEKMSGLVNPSTTLEVVEKNEEEASIGILKLRGAQASDGPRVTFAAGVVDNEHSGGKVNLNAL